jgi:hypothetical protein
LKARDRKFSGGPGVLSIEKNLKELLDKKFMKNSNSFF